MNGTAPDRQFRPFTREDRRKFFRRWPIKVLSFFGIAAIMTGFIAGFVGIPAIFRAQHMTTGTAIGIALLMGFITLLLGFIFFIITRNAVRWLRDAAIRQKYIMCGRLERIARDKGNRSLQIDGKEYAVPFQDWDALAAVKPGDFIEIHISRFSGWVLLVEKQ